MAPNALQLRSTSAAAATGSKHAAEKQPHHVSTCMGAAFDNPWPSWKDPSLGGIVKLLSEMLKVGGGRIPTGELIDVRKPTKEDFR